MIELKKLEKTPEQEQNNLYRWAKLIAAEGWEDVREAAAGDPYMEEVEKIMIKMSQDEKERYLYLRESMAYTDQVSRLATARSQGLQEGMQLGRAEGMRLGQEEGIRNLIESLQEVNIPLKDIVHKVMEKYQLPQADAELAVDQYLK